MMKRIIGPIAALGAMAVPFTALASEGTGGTEGHGGTFPLVFFFLIVMLVFARIGALMERIGQPAVLGELLMGVVLGTLAFVPGLHFIDDMRHEELIIGIAEIGVILLLFRTGLESNIREMKSVGLKALLVAVVGVALPFIGGFYAAKMLIPGLATDAYLFIGATLTATSVGITARVFKDLDVLSTKEAKIVLGAAVFDDILGLLILAIVAGIVSGGSVSAGTIGWLSLKALLFLGGAIIVGQVAAPRLGTLFSRVHTGVGMKMALALLFCGAFAYGAAALAGLAPIVGAFAAGLVLDPVHFAGFAAPTVSVRLREWVDRLHQNGDGKGVIEEMEKAAHEEEHAHVENLIDGISFFFVPIFFVYTGLQVNLETFADPSVLWIALVITAVAFVGKVAAGWVAGSGVDKALIGFGMVPRGEVGLIFANVGKQLGVVSDSVFSVVVIVVILTTLLTPPILGAMVKKRKLLQPAAATS